MRKFIKKQVDKLKTNKDIKNQQSHFSGRKSPNINDDFAVSTKRYTTPEKQKEQYDQSKQKQNSESDNYDTPISRYVPKEKNLSHLSEDKVRELQRQEKQNEIEQHEWSQAFIIEGDRKKWQEKLRQNFRNQGEEEKQYLPLDNRKEYIIGISILNLKQIRRREELLNTIYELPELQEHLLQNWNEDGEQYQIEMTSRLRKNILNHKLQKDLFQWESKRELSPELQVVLQELSPECQNDISPKLQDILSKQPKVKDELPPELHKKLQELVPKLENRLGDMRNNEMNPEQQDKDRKSVLNTHIIDLEYIKSVIDMRYAQVQSEKYRESERKKLKEQKYTPDLGIELLISEMDLTKLTNLAGIESKHSDQIKKDADIDLEKQSKDIQKQIEWYREKLNSL